MILSVGDGESLRLEGRNGAIWREVVINQRTQEDVGLEYGLSQPRISQILQQVRERIPDRDREAMVQDTLEVLGELHRTAMDLMRMAGAPVTAGKDGTVVYDPETNEPVRDYSLRLNALKGALAVSESMRRLVGLDAAKGLDVNVTGAEDAAARKVAEDAARRVAGADLGDEGRG
jgi:hypothetical protein